jgi:hypothetical protein
VIPDTLSRVEVEVVNMTVWVLAVTKNITVTQSTDFATRKGKQFTSYHTSASFYITLLL